MKLTDLDPELIDRIKACRFDRYIEKHEGPFDWEYLIEYPPEHIHTDITVTEVDLAEFMIIEGRSVLLPVARKQHANITIERCICSEDGNVLTIFLRDTTWESEGQLCFLAICERFPEQGWFITTLYHERYEVTGLYG